MNTFTQRLFRSAHRSLDDLESWLSRPERPNLPTWAVQVPRCAALPAPQAQKPAARPPVRSTAYAWRQRAALFPYPEHVGRFGPRHGLCLAPAGSAISADD